MTSKLEDAVMDSRRQALAQRLAEGAAALGVPLSEVQRDKLLRYLLLLDKWSAVYNLTAVRDPEEMVVRHLLDSLAVAPHIKGPRVLDVGTGGGLPGIPLAIVYPNYEFTLLDSVAKKTRFILQTIGELGLSNVRVKTCRVENHRPEELYDTVVSRAFAHLHDYLTAAGRLCRPNGTLLAMKGRYPEAELKDLPKGFYIEEVARLTVPGLEEQRHMVRLARDF